MSRFTTAWGWQMFLPQTKGAHVSWGAPRTAKPGLSQKWLRRCPWSSHLFQNIGCDYEIDSYAVEDRCGVCHGDGSTCRTVKKTFEESEGLGECAFISGRPVRAGDGL